MDELLKVIMMEATKQAAQKKCSMNNDELSSVKKDATEMARYTKMQYDQFIEVGFTEEQATRFIVAILN